MPKGEFYIFVESKDGSDATFSITYDSAADQMAYMCVTGRTVNVTTKPLDLSTGHFTLTEQTTVDGPNEHNMSPVTPCGISGSTKSEAVYPFFLEREAQILAKISNVAASEEGKTYKSLIYITSCKENLGSLVKTNGKTACSASAVSADTNELETGTLSPGLYNLVIDSTDNTINFDLEVSIVGMTSS